MFGRLVDYNNDQQQSTVNSMQLGVFSAFVFRVSSECQRDCVLANSQAIFYQPTPKSEPGSFDREFP